MTTRASLTDGNESAAPGASAPAGLTSVIIVSFNSGTHLTACVRSVLSSTTPVEVLVVDNGSTDESLEGLRGGLGHTEARVRILENGANLGFASASNRALRAARGAWLLLLNPDCVVDEDTIERMRFSLEHHPDAGLAGCLIRNPDGSEQAGCRRERPTPARAFVRAFGLGELGRRLGAGDGILRDFVRQGDPLPPHPVELEAVSGAFMYVRRKALDEVGLLDEGYFLHCEDLDWCERFRRAGWRVLFVPGVAIVHAKGVSSRDRPVRVLWHMHRGMVRYYRKFLRDEYPRPVTWLVTVAVWARFGVLALAASVRGSFARVAGR